MKILRDFKCPDCLTVYERFLDASVTQVPCACGEAAIREISMPTVSLEGISGDFPGAHARWAKIREDNARIKAKRST